MATINVPRMAPNFIQSHCDIAGCEKPHRAKGFCSGHYMRWSRNLPMVGVREQAGIEMERTRIIKLLEENAQGEYKQIMFTPKLIALIKGETNVQ